MLDTVSCAYEHPEEAHIRLHVSITLILIIPFSSSKRAHDLTNIIMVLGLTSTF